MINAAVSGPEFIGDGERFSAGQFRPARPRRGAPFTAIEQSRQLRRRQRDLAGRGCRWPDELALLEPFGQHAQAHAIMPDELDQPGTPPAKGEHGAAERILGKRLLRQHCKPCHAFSHISDTTREINAQARGKGDHRLSSTARTRRSAEPSTSAFTARITPLGKLISMRPPGPPGLRGGEDNAPGA